MNEQTTTFYQLLTAALQDVDNADQLREIFIKRCPTPGDFQRLSLEAESELLMESKGRLGSLLAAMRLGQLALTSQPISYGTAYSSSALGKAMVDRLASETCETVVIACTDVHNEIITLETLFKGGQAECHVYPEEILRYALKNGAHGLVMVHNHPSGQPTPSNCDLKLMKRLETACSIVGLQLLDCLITGHRDYYSMREVENSGDVAG
ncbi:JAB domain-containing protein [uncultured Limosilactobacillus sp.]|uniref:JAB domain-containing protein n=1 Tax=uncultured Limosilactobacillus sp. TaxID=2837629 RepID=UPI0025E87859|nr:JAB domain-containing protein [uncultured Limosilactobacillus sp.]